MQVAEHEPVRHLARDNVAVGQNVHGLEGTLIARVNVGARRQVLRVNRRFADTPLVIENRGGNRNRDFGYQTPGRAHRPAEALAEVGRGTVVRPTLEYKCFGDGIAANHRMYGDGGIPRSRAYWATGASGSRLSRIATNAKSSSGPRLINRPFASRNSASLIRRLSKSECP